MADDEINDPTAPFNELESFGSIFEALSWEQIKKRVPICFKKTIYNRYFLANFVYLVRRKFHFLQIIETKILVLFSYMPLEFFSLIFIQLLLVIIR